MQVSPASPSATDHRYARRYTFAFDQSDDGMLQNVEANEHDGKNKSLVQNGVNQRLAATLQPASNFQVLGYQHHFRQHESIEQCQTLPCEVRPFSRRIILSCRANSPNNNHR